MAFKCHTQVLASLNPIYHRYKMFAVTPTNKFKAYLTDKTLLAAAAHPHQTSDYACVALFICDVAIAQKNEFISLCSVHLLRAHLISRNCWF